MQKNCYTFFIIYSFLYFYISTSISATEKEDTVSVNVFNNMYYGTLEKIMMANLFFIIF